MTWMDPNTLKSPIYILSLSAWNKKKQSQTTLIVLHPAGIADSTDSSFLMHSSKSETRKLERIQ